MAIIAWIASCGITGSDSEKKEMQDEMIVKFEVFIATIEVGCTEH